MATSRKSDEVAVRRLPAATTPEARENQLISMSYDLVEKQIIEGTVSPQILKDFIKAGSTRDRLEKARIEREIKLADAKIESMASMARVEALYSEAMDAFREYRGVDPTGDDEEIPYGY